MTKKVSIVILNYNGAKLLPQCLPSVVAAARLSQFQPRVVILDNGGNDNGLAYVEKEFPDVEIVKAPENLLLCSYNAYLASVQEDIAILLNNDIRVDAGFVDPLIRIFEKDGRTFLAAPRTMAFDGASIEAGRSKAGFKWGLFFCTAQFPGYEKEALLPSETSSSGFGAISVSKFVALGGYDPYYLPGIMEDVDLCLRAQRAGYKLYYEPSSIVYHIGQASFKKEFGAFRISILAHRNNFLFMWKNFSGLKFWVAHIFFLPFRLLFAMAKGNWGLVMGFGEALKKPSKKESN